MKTILTIAFVAFLAVTTSAVATDVHPSYTQSLTNSCFDNFRAHRQGQKEIALSWATSSPEVIGFEIQQSFNGRNFFYIGETAYTGESSYKFVHENPYSGTYYFRVVAKKADGTTEASAAIKVLMVQGGK